MGGWGGGIGDGPDPDADHFECDTFAFISRPVMLKHVGYLILLALNSIDYHLY